MTHISHDSVNTSTACVIDAVPFALLSQKCCNETNREGVYILTACLVISSGDWEAVGYI